jgi:hypothetical protein
MSNFNTTTERVFSELQQPASMDVSDGSATIINALFTKETGADRLNYFLKLEPKDIYKLIQEPKMLENITKDIIIPNECPVQTAQEFCYHVIMKKIGLIKNDQKIWSETMIENQKIVDYLFKNTSYFQGHLIAKLLEWFDDNEKIANLLKYYDNNKIWLTLQYFENLEKTGKILKYFDDNEKIAILGWMKDYPTVGAILKSWNNREEIVKFLRCFNNYEKITDIMRWFGGNKDIALLLEWFDDIKEVVLILEYFNYKKIIRVLEYYDEDFKQFSQIPNISRYVNLNKQKIAGILKLFKDNKKIGNVLMWIVSSGDFEWLADIFKFFEDLEKVWNILCSIENTWIIWEILKFFDNTEIAKILKCFDDSTKATKVLNSLGQQRANKINELST